VRHPIPLSSYILDFEVLSIGVPMLLFLIRRRASVKLIAKAWGGVFLFAILLQVFCIGYERVYTFPMRWSLEIPQELRDEIKPGNGFAGQKAVIFSRPALTEQSRGKHTCYQVVFSDALAKRLQGMGQEVIAIEYDAKFRFDTPIGYSGPRLKGEDKNIAIGGIGYMSQGYSTSGYTCFPGPGLFQ
jgi:hypothetical protein